MKFFFGGKFNLKFEIPDVKYLVKFGGKTFRPAKKAPNISGRISGQISTKIFRKLRFKGERLQTRFAGHG